MSAQALHLNLLNPHERRSSSPVRARVLLPLGAGLCLAFILLWIGFIGVNWAIVSGQHSGIRSEIGKIDAEYQVAEGLKRRFRDLQAEAEQYGYYVNGRCERGELLKALAYAIPDGVTLTSLSIPPPPDQNLYPPPNVKRPPLQGPTGTCEKVELRIAGIAQAEQDVFQLMKNLKGEAFTNQIVIAERTAVPSEASPRVLAFRQEAAQGPNGTRNVFFDIVYALKPRAFVK